MELAGKVAVVTGGASGIGRALALAFAQEGAAGVVVADLDGDGTRRVAQEIGERALAVRCDVADPGHATTLLAAAEEAFGPVALYCANAGIGVGAGLGDLDEWDAALAVNTTAHVHAARALLPGWLDRGEGYFLATASAAGLLTQIGSAPYAVTKHAAVAFAEWLAVTYGDRGIRASCLCPMGVNTPLLNAGLDAPRGQGGLSAAVVAAAGEILEPEDVAAIVLDGLRDERFLILPHPEVLEFFRRKGGDYDRWIAGMRRLQSQLAG